MSLFILIAAGIIVWLIVAFVVAIGFGRVIARRDQQTPTMVIVGTQPINTVPRKDDHQWMRHQESAFTR